MENIIKRAIEGGYTEGYGWDFVSANYYWAIWRDGNNSLTSISVERYLMNPLFWICLGKACEPDAENRNDLWIGIGVDFHRQNLENNFGKAIKWLESIIN